MRLVNWTAVEWLARRVTGAAMAEDDAAFGRVIEERFAEDPAMLQLARIVRGADRPERFDVMPESPGLRAMVEGAAALYETNDEIVAFTTPVFDALLASLRQRLESGQALESDPLLDAVSGLPNRLLLLDRLTQAIAYAHRHDTIIALCVIRFDFSRVEEHVDRIVFEIADRLRHTVRELDTMSRLGTDEFGLAITDLRQRESADVAVRKIADILYEPYDIGEKAYEIVPRIGVSFYPAHGHDGLMLLAAARDAVPQEASIAVFGESQALT